LISGKTRLLSPRKDKWGKFLFSIIQIKKRWGEKKQELKNAPAPDEFIFRVMAGKDKAIVFPPIFVS